MTTDQNQKSRKWKLEADALVRVTVEFNQPVTKDEVGRLFLIRDYKDLELNDLYTYTVKRKEVV